MIVALDQSHTRQADAGIARYARGLASALRRRDDVSVIEIGGGSVVPRGSLRKRLLTAKQDFLWYPFTGRRRALRAHADLYHVPLLRGPVTQGKPPLVLTIHDLVALRFPETTTPWSRIQSRLTWKRTLAAADLIITVSENTAADVQAFTHIPAERIRSIHNGVDARFFRGPGTDNRDNGGNYVLFVGTPEPRKNLKRLADAVALARARGIVSELIIAGAGGWGDAAATGDHVRALGRVSDDELFDLYANAACVALPSMHEGFGLPAVEAMAVGAPVVAARAGALPEITGGAAVLVDPLDINDIARGIEEAIAERVSLVAAGRRRAQHFSWDRTAAETVAAYRELL